MMLVDLNRVLQIITTEDELEGKMPAIRCKALAIHAKGGSLEDFYVQSLRDAVRATKDGILNRMLQEFRPTV